MNTDTFNNVEGRKVVASDTAESIGSVRSFVMDTGGRRIEEIHVDGRGKRAVVLNWRSIDAFGADAVMATAGAQPSTIHDDHEKAAVSGAVAMVGTRVLTVAGREFGIVSDVEFDTETGTVVCVNTDHGPIAVDRVRSLGSYALVVDEAAPSPAG
jgi:uncharacterized protein YrrD